MKKVTLAIALAALVMFAGCNKDKETQGTTLKASIEQQKGDSKTSLNPTDGAISWTAGDKISLTRERLLADLRQAYFDARRHKRNKPYQQRFEANLEQNLVEVCDELFNRTYKAKPSTCFIINLSVWACLTIVYGIIMDERFVC